MDKKKRVLLNHLSTEVLRDVVINLFEKEDIDIVFWDSAPFGEPARTHLRERMPSTIFTNFEEEQEYGRPKDIDASYFTPVGEDVIAALQGYEPTIFSMINRKDVHHTSAFQKRHQYFHHLIYWNGVLQATRP